MVDIDVIKGKLKQVEGKLQDAWGDIAGNPQDDIDGKAKQVQGALQEGYGHGKEAARKAELDAAREEGRAEQHAADLDTTIP